MDSGADTYKKPEERRLNKQINYYIIRRMYQIHHGRDAENTIYNVFDTSRARFTRVIDTGAIRYYKGEIEELAKKTCIDTRYFTGEYRFLIRNMSEDDWKEFFLRRKDRAKSKIAKGDYEAIEKTVKRKIYDSRAPKLNENKGLFALCYFCKNGRGMPLDGGGEQYSSLMAILKEYDIYRLQQYDSKALKGLMDELSDKVRLISAIITCRKAEQAASKKK